MRTVKYGSNQTTIITNCEQCNVEIARRSGQKYCHECSLKRARERVRIAKKRNKQDKE